MPPSVTTWGARVRWELAIVQAFGVTYPKADVEHIQAGAFVTDLVFAVAQARDQGDSSTLDALLELLETYKSRLGALLPMLRRAAEKSHRPVQPEPFFLGASVCAAPTVNAAGQSRVTPSLR